MGNLESSVVYCNLWEVYRLYSRVEQSMAVYRQSRAVYKLSRVVSYSLRQSTVRLG